MIWLRAVSELRHTGAIQIIRDILGGGGLRRYEVSLEIILLFETHMLMLLKAKILL